jgi:hypothetical protein
MGDGQTESGVSIGDAVHAPGFATLPRVAICAQASHSALSGTCRAPTHGFLMSLRPLMLHPISPPQSSHAGTVQSPPAIEIAMSHE